MVAAKSDFWSDLTGGAGYGDPVRAGLKQLNPDLEKAWTGPEGLVFGNDENPGLLGMGQFAPKMRELDGTSANITGYDGSRAYLGNQAAKMNFRQAPQLGAAAQFGGAQINMSPQDQWRQRQTDLYSRLDAQARGEGPSLAQMQLQRGADSNMAQAMALGASQRGAGGGGALRQIGNQRAQIGQQLAGDSAMMRLQEQQMAQAQMAGLANQSRGMDASLAAQQAGLSQQAGLANMAANNQFSMANQDASMRQTQMNDAASLGYMQQQQALDLADQRAREERERMRMEQNLREQEMRQKSYENKREQGGNILSSVGGGLMALFSDERTKENVQDAGGKVYSFLDALGTHEYDYKKPYRSMPEGGEGKRVSVMAQELEKSEIGKALVETGKDGLKRVHYGKGLPVMLAAQAALHKRLKALEEKE